VPRRHSKGPTVLTAARLEEAQAEACLGKVAMVKAGVVTHDVVVAVALIMSTEGGWAVDLDTAARLGDPALHSVTAC
jgi:hypothetical protein